MSNSLLGINKTNLLGYFANDAQATAFATALGWLRAGVYYVNTVTNTEKYYNGTYYEERIGLLGRDGLIATYAGLVAAYPPSAVYAWVQAVVAGPPDTLYICIRDGAGVWTWLPIINGGMSLYELISRDYQFALWETWQNGLDITIWGWLDPAGAAWAEANLQAQCTLNLNDVARMRCLDRWPVTPGLYGTGTLIKQIAMEFELYLGTVANVDAAESVFGFTDGPNDTGSTNNIIAFRPVNLGAGNWGLQSVTDNAGAETANNSGALNFATGVKAKIIVRAGEARFYINEALLAAHVTNLTDNDKYPNLYVDTTAGGGTTFYIGRVNVWPELV